MTLYSLKAALDDLPRWLLLLTVGVFASNLGSKVLAQTLSGTAGETTSATAGADSIVPLLQYVETGGVVGLLLAGLVYLYRKNRETETEHKQTGAALLERATEGAAAAAESAALRSQLDEKSQALERLAHENRQLTQRLLEREE